MKKLTLIKKPTKTQIDATVKRHNFQVDVFEIFDKELAAYDGLRGRRWTITGRIYDEIVLPMLKKARRRAR